MVDRMKVGIVNRLVDTNLSAQKPTKAPRAPLPRSQTAVPAQVNTNIDYKNIEDFNIERNGLTYIVQVKERDG